LKPGLTRGGDITSAITTNRCGSYLIDVPRRQRLFFRPSPIDEPTDVDASAPL
jgi:hypothetical protein